jgi:hypothetical protein
MVKSLVPVDAALGGHPTPTVDKEIGATIAAGKAGSMAEAKRIWPNVSLFTPANEQPKVAAKLQQIVGAYHGRHLINGPGMHEQPLQPPAAQRLGQIKAPTLVVVGAREVLDLQLIADKLAKESPARARRRSPMSVTCRTWKRRRSSTASFSISCRASNNPRHVRTRPSGSVPDR